MLVKFVLPVIFNTAKSTYLLESQLEKSQHDAILNMQKEYLQSEKNYKICELELEELQQKFIKIQNNVSLKYKTLCHQYERQIQRQKISILNDYKERLLEDFFITNKEEIKEKLLNNKEFLQEWKNNNKFTLMNSLEKMQLVENVSALNKKDNKKTQDEDNEIINFSELLTKIENQW